MKKTILKEALLVVLVSFIIIVGIPLMVTQFSLIDYQPYGTIGDTIGGITSPFVGLLGAYLVYKAFIIQKDANELLSAQNSVAIIQYLVEESTNSIDLENGIAAKRKFRERVEANYPEYSEKIQNKISNALIAFHNTNKSQFELNIYVINVLRKNAYQLECVDLKTYSTLHSMKTKRILDECLQVKELHRQFLEKTGLDLEFPADLAEFIDKASDFEASENLI